MLSVLLVDDEPIMRVALNSMIDWNEYGFEVCGTASNGEEALRFIEQLNPDIVITDLKMPKMDGIELIRQINRHDYHCKVLVISNYPDYELVREALTLGAVDYLLKINMRQEDLLNQLNTIKQLIVQSKSHLLQKKQEKSLLNNNVKKLILREFFNSDCDDITQLSPGMDLNFYHSTGQCMLCYVIPKYDSAQQRPDIENLEQIISAVFCHFTNLEVFSLNSESVVALIPNDSFTTDEIISQLQKALKTYISSEYTIIYINNFNSYVDARSKLELCKTTSSIQFYQDLSIVNADKVHLQYYLDFMPHRIFCETMIKQCNMIGHMPAKRMLNDFITMCSERLVYPEIVKQYICKTLECISIQMLDLTDEQHTKINLMIKKISGISNTHNLIMFIQENLPLIFAPTTINNDVCLVLDYLNQNYKEKISLASIAAHVHLNESYLCRIFKKEMDTTIISYLNSLRMEKAGELIKQKSLPISEVCEILNIESLPYFYRLFKDHFGVPPSKFRAHGEIL